DGVTPRILANARPPGQNLREIRQVLSPGGLPARGIYGVMAPGREALRTLAAPGLTLENRYYAPGAERAGKVRTLFGRIARRYDLINDLMSAGMHRRWKRLVVRLAALRPGERGLDLCCGTGDVAR